MSSDLFLYEVKMCKLVMVYAGSIITWYGSLLLECDPQAGPGLCWSDMSIGCLLFGNRCTGWYESTLVPYVIRPFPFLKPIPMVWVYVCPYFSFWNGGVQADLCLLSSYMLTGRFRFLESDSPAGLGLRWSHKSYGYFFFFFFLFEVAIRRLAWGYADLIRAFSIVKAIRGCT